MPVAMKAKFAGNCRAPCGRPIAKGSPIIWDRPAAYHQSCAPSAVMAEIESHAKALAVDNDDRRAMYGGDLDFFGAGDNGRY